MRALARGAGAQFPRDLEDGHLPGRTSGTLAPCKGGHRLLEEPWPGSLAPSGGPGGSKPFLNKAGLYGAVSPPFLSE